MIQAGIQTMLIQLFFCHRLAAFKIKSIRIADRNVVGGILVKERVVEQNAGLRNRGAVRHESDLS
ncbi:hypothetical protein D3C78_1065260 [compost metagenome]